MYKIADELHGDVAKLLLDYPNLLEIAVLGWREKPDFFLNDRGYQFLLDEFLLELGSESNGRSVSAWLYISESGDFQKEVEQYDGWKDVYWKKSDAIEIARFSRWSYPELKDKFIQRLDEYEVLAGQWLKHLEEQDKKERERIQSIVDRVANS